MLQGIERLGLELLFWFYSLPSGAAIALALLSLALLGYQYLQRGKMVSPGLLAAIGIYGAIRHYFQREATIEWIVGTSQSFDIAQNTMTPIPVLEPLFSFLIAPAEYRSVWEEGVLVAALLYALSLTYHMLRSRDSAPKSSRGILNFLRKRGTARPMRSKTNELGSGALASNEQIVGWTQ